MGLLDTLRAQVAGRSDANVGFLAEFSDPGALLHAAKELRRAGYRRLDTFSPFPIHGMDRALGLGTSMLGYLCFIGGATGLTAGFLLQWWTSEVNYSINISNKPFFAIESSVPIMFELTILFAAATAVFGMLAINGLPKPYNPLFYSERFGRASDDGFFLHIAAADGQYSEDKTPQALYDAGALAVERVNHVGAEPIGRAGSLLTPGAN
jgi:ActD protein